MAAPTFQPPNPAPKPLTSLRQKPEQSHQAPAQLSIPLPGGSPSVLPPVRFPLPPTAAPGQLGTQSVPSEGKAEPAPPQGEHIVSNALLGELASEPSDDHSAERRIEVPTASTCDVVEEPIARTPSQASAQAKANALPLPVEGVTVRADQALYQRTLKPIFSAAHIPWHGWHAFRRGLARNLHRLGVDDKTIQAILRHCNVAITQNIYIKTPAADTVAAMQRLESALSFSDGSQLGKGVTSMPSKLAT